MRRRSTKLTRICSPSQESQRKQVEAVLSDMRNQLTLVILITIFSLCTIQRTLSKVESNSGLQENNPSKIGLRPYSAHLWSNLPALSKICFVGQTCQSLLQQSKYHKILTSVFNQFDSDTPVHTFVIPIQVMSRDGFHSVLNQ